MTVSSSSSPILRAAEFLRARYSLFSLILFITAVALGLGLGRIVPNFLLMVGVFAVAVCSVFGLFRSPVAVYRQIATAMPNQTSATARPCELRNRHLGWSAARGTPLVLRHCALVASRIGTPLSALSPTADN